MATYSIDDFWIPKFHDIEAPSFEPALPGWMIRTQLNSSFVQADLTLRDGFEDLSAPVWLVAAPGAVGKSTLSREIAAQTGVAHLDLAKAATVAGNYLTGGLVQNNLLDLWKREQTTVLIDGLDEARLKVTQDSYEDFLRDVVRLSSGRRLPTVMFGRVGIIGETWLSMSDLGVDAPILDIEFFDIPRGIQFVVGTLKRLAKQKRYERLASSLLSHENKYHEASETLVTHLAAMTSADGVHFAGYAPVLEAVATSLADKANPSKLVDAADEHMTDNVLNKLTSSILGREATKLRDNLEAIAPEKRDGLYAPQEQLERLSARIFQTSEPALPSGLNQSEASIYDNALKSWLPQHPFLDGAGREPSGAVFSAIVSAHALLSRFSDVVAAAEIYAGRGPHTPNPFLCDFYLKLSDQNDEALPIVPPEHVILLYESIRAKSARGEVARLSIDADEDDDALDVEIQISNTDMVDPGRRVLFRSSQAGELRFSRQISGTNIDAPNLDVVIGAGEPVEILVPVALNVARLSFACSGIIVQLAEANTLGDATATIEASELRKSTISSSPVVRPGSELAVSWPGATAYPWTHFANLHSEDATEDTGDLLRGLRRLVLAFRSHSKGRLARFVDKIEHRRITKGEVGVSIRKKLMADGVLSREGSMYFLDPVRLGELTGATYQDLKFKRFNNRVRSYTSAIR